jgi:hypothetical protein
MIDPQDPGTKPLDLGPGHEAQPPTRAEAAPGVPSIVAERVDARLADEFDLVRVHSPVYVLDKKAAAERSAGAERVARHRQKLADEGRRPASVPVTVLDEVKAAGGWDQWQAQKAAAAVPPAPQVVEVEKRVEVPGPERLVEKRVEVPAKLSNRELESLNLGRAVQQLTGWRRALAHFALAGAEIPPK